LSPVPSHRNLCGALPLVLGPQGLGRISLTAVGRSATGNGRIAFGCVPVKAAYSAISRAFHRFMETANRSNSLF